MKNKKSFKFSKLASGTGFSVALLLTVLVPLKGLAQQAGNARIDAYLAELVETTHIPGVVAMVASKDQVLYAGAFGDQVVASDTGMELNSIFRLASMTKPITSAAVLILMEDGRIALDDPISQYLPAYASKEVIVSFDSETGELVTRPPSQAITIRHLLTHTSGIGYPFSNELLRQLELAGLDTEPESAPLVSDPGSQWVYGSSTRVLGYLVEALSGQSLETFLNKRIFQPLGMQETSFHVEASQMSRVVTTHVTVNGRLQEIPNPESIAAPETGDGGLNSTAADYVRFMQMILNGGMAADGERILSEQSVAMMGQNHIGEIFVETQPAANPALVRPFPLGAGQDKFGLGFKITGDHDSADQRSAGSMSWDGVYNTEFWIDPVRGIGAVMLMQYLPFYDAAALEGLRGFERLVYEQL